MTDAVGSTYAPIDRTLASVGSLQKQVGLLQEQVSTGRKAQSYAGLGGLSSQVVDLTAAKARAATYDQVIAGTQAKAAVVQDVLGQIGSVVEGVSTAALALTGTSPASTVTSVAQQARNAFTQVASLLNTQYGGEYLFSGADTANPPVPGAADATGSELYKGIAAAVAGLAAVPATPVATVVAGTVAIASSTDPATSIFSAYLNGAGAAAPAAQVRLSDTWTVGFGVTANRNVAGVASDPSIGGTGSAFGDILRGLAVIATSTTATTASPDFRALIQDATGTLSSAGGTLAEIRGSVGQTQQTLTAAASASASFQLVLTKQLGSLTDVDSATAISDLQAVSTQLQASYKVLSLASSLHLASYL